MNQDETASDRTDLGGQTAIDTLESLLFRRSSCRGFLATPVDRSIVERVLAVAQRTASWCNSQPWHVTITSGAATESFRRTLYDHAASKAPSDSDFAFPAEYRGAYKARRLEAGFRLYEAVGVERGDADGRARQSLENFRFFGAPHVAIITTDAALGPYGAVDCGAYVANFLIAAKAMGLATIPQAALAYHAGFVRRHLGIGEDRHVICGISFGYPDLEHPANRARTSRAGLDEAVTWRD